MNDGTTGAVPADGPEGSVPAVEATAPVSYRWRVRMEGTGAVYTTPSRMTDEQARSKYGERIVERIETSAR